jgi:hypothetical protein
MPPKLKYLTILTCFPLPSNALLHLLSLSLSLCESSSGNISSLFSNYASWRFPQMGSQERVMCIWNISDFHYDSKLIFIQVLYKTLWAR